MKKDKHWNLLPEIMEDHKDSIRLAIEKLKQKRVKENFIDSTYSSISSSYAELAMCELLLHGDVSKSKQYFYQAAVLRMFLLRAFDEKTMIVNKSYVSMSNFQKLFWAILSDNEELIVSFAQELGGRPEVEHEYGHPFSNHLGYALKFLILHDENQADKHIKPLLHLESLDVQEEDEQVDAELHSGFGIVLNGIVKGDANQVENGLLELLKAHRKNPEYHQSPEQYFAVEVLALAKLAKRYGLTVDLDDPLAPKEMLEHHEIDYPEMEFFPDQLQ
ncbi:immunity 49 family protein [Tumebacillus flagellatus]|uniref:immunity 49 family protein n=1 Tax=Tumebacillus flagellatus TaxID=1157490 RepID=UPI001267A18E|nr:immunity 49 family protein [Tumebacillus flagellatus]